MIKVLQDPRAAKDVGVLIVDFMVNGFPADFLPESYYLGNTIRTSPFMAGPALMIMVLIA